MFPENRGMVPILEIFQIIMGFISACKTPPAPAPVNPTPTPTPAQSAAWGDAWKLKTAATEERQGPGQFSGKSYRKTVAETRKKSRRDGKKMGKREAEDAVSQSFEDAFSSSMPDIYGDICEFRHS